MGGLCVSKGLEFFRFFCDSDKPEAKLLENQLKRLRSYENHLAIEGVYYRLVAWASRYTRECRGYVWAFEYLADVPATEADIALSVGLSDDECRSYLQALIDARLVEWVYATEAHGGQGRPLEASPEAEARPTESPPGSEPPPGGPPEVAGTAPAEPTDNELNGPTVPTKDNNQRSNDLTCNDAAHPGEPLKDQRSTTAPRNEVQGPLTGQQSKKANESVPSKPPSEQAAVGDESGNEMSDWQERKKSELEQRAKGEQAMADESQRPISPTKSDAGGGDKLGTSPSPSCGGLAETDRRRNKRIAQAHWDSGVMVFRLLGMPQVEGTEEYLNEVSSFASKIQEAGAWPLLVDKGMKHASELKKMKNYSPQSKARIWNSTMSKRIAGKSQRQRARA